MKLSILLLLVVLSMTTKANDPHRVHIVSYLDHQPISFAVLTYYKKDSLIGGSYANAEGVVTLKTPEKASIIQFSCVGYQTKWFSLPGIIPDTVNLEPVNITLPEIVINSDKKNKLIELGYIKKSSLRAFGSKKNTEFAVFIPNKTGKKMVLQTLLYKIRQEVDVKNALRVHLYAVDESKFMPGKDLVQSNLIFYIEGKHISGKVISFDLSNYGIQIPDSGVFVGLEWIGIIDIKNETPDILLQNDPTVFITNFITDKFSFTRGYFTKNIWKPFDLRMKEGKFQNFSFGMEAIDY
jgi:hypothetical protein